MVLLELIKLSSDKKVAVDMYGMPPKLASDLTEPNRIVFLVTTPERVVRDYYNRPGHTAIYDCIMELNNPEAAFENVNKMLAYGTQLYLDELYQTGMYNIIRDDNSTVDKTLALVETHFEMKTGGNDKCTAT